MKGKTLPVEFNYLEILVMEKKTMYEIDKPIVSETAVLPSLYQSVL